MKTNIHQFRTHCGRMDHGGCALLVEVQDNRIISIKGDPEGFLNRGYICPKGRNSSKRLDHPLRLTSPLKRIGNRGEGKWQKISWDEALDTIAENLQNIKAQYGAKAVAFCQGMPKGLEHFVLIRLANIFGSPNVVAVQDVCHAPREVSGIHTCGFYPVPDFHHPSKLVVAWGSNLTATNEEGTICSQLLSQLKQGTELIVIDPQKTALAQKAKYWLQIKPGTDSALALAFLNVIICEKLYDKDFVNLWTHGFEELTEHIRQYPPEKIANITEISAELIREAARYYAGIHPAAILWGNPIEQNTDSFHTSRALTCLMAICGNLDVAGGNIDACDPNILSLGKFVRADLIPDKPKTMIHAHYRTIPKLMTVPSAFFRKAVLEEIPYPVKAAYMQCCNPLMAYSDSRKTREALLKLDFISVSDIVMTPTALFADIVLPAATQFEFNDIGHYGIGHGYILARPKVVDPPKDCLPDMQMLNELGNRLTDPKYWHDNYEKFLEDIVAPSGLNYSEFAEKGYLKGEDRFRKYLISGFSTPTGKVELKLSRAEKFGLAAFPESHILQHDPEFPLILTSCKDPYYLHSSYRWIESLRHHSPKPMAKIHPDTAKDSDIRDGENVCIETRFGKIVQCAKITENVMPGVVYAAYGWWFPENSDTQFDWQKSNYNMLTSSEIVGKEFGTPNLKGIPCRIIRQKP